MPIMKLAMGSPPQAFKPPGHAYDPSALKVKKPTGALVWM
jgi:hypothetical protein